MPHFVQEVSEAEYSYDKQKVTYNFDEDDDQNLCFVLRRDVSITDRQDSGTSKVVGIDVLSEDWRALHVPKFSPVAIRANFGR